MSYKSPGTSNWNEGNFEEGLHEQTRSRESSFNDISYIHVILNIIKIRVDFLTKKKIELISMEHNWKTVECTSVSELPLSLLDWIIIEHLV